MEQALLNQYIPYSQEAEEAVIGAVIVNPASFYSVASFLNAEDFFILRHQHIWEALVRLNERGDDIDYITIAQELKNVDKLEEIGGEAYIIQLINNTPTSIHAEVYGRLVERAAIRRRLLSAADRIKLLALDEELTVERVMDAAETELFGVSERQLSRELIPMREALSQYYDQLEALMQAGAETVGLPTGFKDLDKLLGGLQKSDLLFFAGRPGMGKCVVGDTLVPTERGLVPIESLKPQKVEGIPDGEGGTYYPLEVGIQSPEGMRKTAFFYDSGVKPTLRLTTRAGYSIEGTYDHPILTLSKDGQKVWKKLAYVGCGEFLAVQRHEAIWGNETKLPVFNFDRQRSDTFMPHFPTEITPDLAYILGLLVGDGCLTSRNSVKISSSDPAIIDLFYDWANGLGLVARHNKNYDYTINSVVLYSWLKHIGLSGYAHEKEAPYTVLRAPRDCVLAFLQGLFDTDGHAEAQKGYIQFVSSSEKLARQVHILLLQFGVVSRLSFKANNHRGAWCIRLTGDSARLFYDRIGFRLERKQKRRQLLPATANANLDVVPYLPKTTARFDRAHEFTRYFHGVKSPGYPKLRQIAAFAPEVLPLLHPQFYWDEVVSIEGTGLRHCYDLTVPDGQAFVTNGIVSHNTSFMLSVALNAARLNGRIGIFSMEMGTDQIVQRLVSMEAAINSQKLRGGQLNQQEWSRFVQVVGNLSGFQVFIDDTPAMTPLQLRSKCQRLKREHGVDLVIVDYVQLMNGGGSYENNRVQEISYISRSLKELAREMNVPILAAAQLSRAVEQRQDKRPVLSDLRESGSLEQDSDIVMFLYRDEVYNEATEFPNQAEIIVAKHRNGPTGTISLYFDKSLTKFLNAAERSIDLSHM